MASTYDLLVQSSHLLDLFDAEQGVMTEESEQALLNWLDASEDKLLACVTASRRLDAEGEILRQEEQRLKARRQVLEAGAERVRGYATALLLAREAMGEEPKAKTAAYSCWLAETQSISGPEDVEAWPEAWRRVRVDPDRASALRAAKAGADLPAGFRLESKRGVRWR